MAALVRLEVPGSATGNGVDGADVARVVFRRIGR
jgi:hypothetical protein